MSRTYERRKRQSQPQHGGRKFLAFLVIITILAGAGWYGYRKYTEPPAAAPIEYPKNPSVASRDGKMKLVIPDGTAPKGSDVQLNKSSESVKIAEDSVKSNRLAFKPISKPIDISFVKDGNNVSDQVMSDKIAVTLEYDPKQIPTGLTHNQVGMVVYDYTLASWVPIHNAKVDPATNTVTALAPHFSWFDVVVLDPAKKTVEVAGHTINTVIDTTVTVSTWTASLVSELVQNMVNDLFAQVEVAKCEPVSNKVTATARSDFDILKVCAEAAGDNSRVRVTNGFAYPLRSSELPSGVSLTMDDIWNNSEDTTELVRSWFWADQKVFYVSGTSRASLTATPNLQSTGTVTMELDDDALAFDIGLAVLSVFAPGKDTASKAVKKGMQATLKGEKLSDQSVDGAKWANTTYGLLDCIAGANHEAADQPYSKEGTEIAANTAYGCLEITLDQLDLKGALAGILSSLKVIPAALQATIHTTGSALVDQLPEQFDSIKHRSPQIVVTPDGKEQSDTKPKPAPTAKPKLPVSEQFRGDWKAGPYTLNFEKRTYRNGGDFCITVPDSMRGTWCTIAGSLTVIANPEQITAFWGNPTFKDENGKEFTPIPKVVQMFKDQGSNFAATDDPRVIIVTSGKFEGVEFCSPEMYKLSKDPYSNFWKRCDGNPY